ncbi:MAG: 5'-nucleotidase C-terminal domain-containing protein [Mucinivorans sp.]
MRLFLALIGSLFISLASVAQSVASNERVVNVAPRAIFPFDPLSGRYVKESLASVVTYVESWRADGTAINLTLYDTLLSDGYKIYNLTEDSTLIARVLTYINATITSSDTSGIYRPSIYDFPQSRTFLTHFSSDIEHIKRFFATPITRFSAPKHFDPYAPNEFSNLMHDYQITASGAELSIFAPTKLDNNFDEEVFISSIYNLFYYDNQLVTVNLTGREIKLLLEKIYDARYYTLRGVESDLLHTTLPPSMHSSLAGTPYTVNLTRGRGAKIEDLTLNPKKIYSVAMNSFAASKLGKAMIYVGSYKMLLIKYLQHLATPKIQENWCMKPERWVNEIKKRESLQIH